MSLRALDTDRPLHRYLALKAEIERLNGELDALKPLITAALWDEPDHRTVCDGFEITLGVRRTYQYSAAVKSLETTLQGARERERATGVAMVVREASYPIAKRLSLETPQFIS